MELGPLDHFFAQRLLKEQGSEDTAHFLAHLMRSSREGHLCLRCSSVPHLPDSIVQEGIDLQPKTWVVKDEDRYYLKKNWIYETYLLQQVQRLRSVPFPKYHEEEKFLMLLDQSHLLEEQKIEELSSPCFPITKKPKQSYIIKVRCIGLMYEERC